MAANAVIGSLRVVLGADTAALDKGLKGAQGSLARFSAGIKNVGLIAAGALAGAVGGAAVAIQSALKDADNLGKLAQSIGLPVEELSKLKYAAELSDVSLEEFGKSVVKLSKNMSEVAGGNTTGAAAMAFKSLGISVRDASGQMKSSDTILAEVADRFASYRDGANKTALAVALFGRAGAAMIPMLNQGSAALRESGKEAEYFGLVIDKKTAVAAETFNDNITKLGKVMQGVFIRIAAGSAETLANLSNTMVDAAKDAKNLEMASTALNGVMKVLASITTIAAYSMKQFTTYFGALISAATKLSSLDFSGAFNDLKQGALDVKMNFDDLSKTLSEIWAPPQSWTDWREALQSSNDAIRDAIGVGERFLDMTKRDAPALPQGGENALQSYLSGIEKRRAALTAEMQTIGMSEAAQESLRIKLEGLTIAKEKNIVVTDEMRAKLEQSAASFGQLSQAVQEARQRWNFIEGSISTVSSGLTDIVMRTTTAGDAFKEMATSIIRDFTQMIIKAQLMKVATSFLGGGFFGGASFAGAGFASGIPQGVGLGGYAGSFATGGSFKVPGSGGIDSKLVSLRATPGERVSVTKDGGYPGGGGQTVQIVMNNDFRGAEANAVAGIGAKLQQLEQRVPGMALAAVSEANRKRPSVTRPR